MGNKASNTRHATTVFGHAVTKGTSKRERHVDANCCSNFCAVGLLYRTPNWQEVTSLHKHLLRDAQAFKNVMSDKTNRQTCHSYSYSTGSMAHIYIHIQLTHSYTHSDRHTVHSDTQTRDVAKVVMTEKAQMVAMNSVALIIQSVLILRSQTCHSEAC